MRIGRAGVDGASVVVAAHEGSWFDLGGAGIVSVAAALRAHGSGELTSLLGSCARLAIGDQQLQAPIDGDARILCAGFNFASHARESGKAEQLPAHPTFFARFATSLVGPAEPIVLPRSSSHFDWEGELAFVVGKPGRSIALEDALSHVGGYVCFGDHSLRDYQQHGTQATQGKNFDRSGAIGPWIVTADEIPSPESLEVFTYLQGEEVQHGRLHDLVFTVPALVAYVSTFLTLRPGDVIATGTPAGIGARRTPPRWLAAGEEIVVEVPGVGRLANRVVAEEDR